MDSKWTQHEPKMNPKMIFLDPKWTQIGPKWTQNVSWRTPHVDTRISARGAWHTCKWNSPRKSYWNMAGREFPIGNVSFYTWGKVILMNECGWHEIDLNDGKYWIKKLIWENQHLLLIMYTWCTQRQCPKSKDTVHKYRSTFESRISAGWTEKLPLPQNSRISSWYYDMTDHAKVMWEKILWVDNRTIQ